MNQALVFGEYRFDPTTGQLWSGAQEVRLTPKSVAVLEVLLSRPGQPVAKEELFEAVWRDTVVSDDALISCIQELRKALGDDAKQPRFIETRHRRGYRFMAPVSQSTFDESVSDSPLSVGSQRGVVANTAGGDVIRTSANTGGKPTVAVLPFDNLSGDPAQEYFSDGITDDIITTLSKHRSLLVVARSSTFAFKGRATDVRQIGITLGADYVVEGSVGKIGGNLRIRSQLIETEGGRHLWADKYDRDLEDIFKVQDELTAAIAARIEPEVGAAERLRAERKPPQSLDGWDVFRLGTKHFYKSTAEDNLEAQRLFRCAIEFDPTLAEAYAFLSYAMILSMIYFNASPDDKLLNEAVTFARKGVELDEQDALTHFTYGRALLARREYQAALAELESAVELNPSLAVGYCGLGDSLSYEGRFKEAIPHFEKAIALSPYDPQRWAFYSYRALAHLFAREFDQALEWAQRATRVPNCHYWPFAHRVAALGHLEDVDALRTAKAELFQRESEFSCAFARRRLFYIKNAAQLEIYVEGLRRAGLAE
jgi:TolB-like protein/Tfp pilus assembly protein PilF